MTTQSPKGTPRRVPKYIEDAILKLGSDSELCREVFRLLPASASCVGANLENERIEEKHRRNEELRKREVKP